MDKRREANRLVKEKISDALQRLLNEKSYGQITVTDIIREAGVARVSFYRNFTDKKDVVFYQMDRTAHPVQDPKKIRTYEGVLTFWREFAQRKDLIVRHYSEELTHVILEYLARAAVPREESGKEDYFASAYLGALFRMAGKWLRGGCKESPETMAKMFCGLWDTKALLAAN